MKSLFAILIAAASVAACTGGARDTSPVPEGEAWQFPDAAETIVDHSCPDGPQDSFAMSSMLEVRPVSLGDADDVAEALDGLVFVGGWALESSFASFASFGGLSGLKVLPDGNLLAVSDAGALVSIPFDQEGLQPGDQATLTYLNDADGEMLAGKSAADAEGLEVRDGIALVSFERDHRVAAYGYDLCGSQARAVTLATMSARPPGLNGRMGDNAGAEALMLDGERAVIGLESTTEGHGPVGEVRADGSVAFLSPLGIDASHTPLVGLDRSDQAQYSLHRAYNPITRRNSIRILSKRDDGASATLAVMAGGLTLDNFEGIAAQTLSNGRDRIFLISDDNFSDSQRTLLYVFETDELGAK
jgi:hypothetical protein